MRHLATALAAALFLALPLRAQKGKRVTVRTRQ